MKQVRMPISSAEAVDVTADLRDRLHKALQILDSMPDPAASVRVSAVDEDDVRRIIRARRTRDGFFNASLFADPAWDILLELYATAVGQRRIAVSSLCDAAAVPATTALRWITNLEKQGYLVRSPDPLDGRRVYVRLSPKAFDAMDAYFASQPRHAIM